MQLSRWNWVIASLFLVASAGLAGSNAFADHHEGEKKLSDIVDTAVGAETFKTLVAAVQAADLVEVLKGKGPFTVFAPNDKAFAKLGDEAIADLLKPENKKKLVAILTYHVVPGKVMAKDVVGIEKAKTVQGQEIKVKVKDEKVHINGATVIAADIEATNGVIHVIDSVILPKL